MDLSMNNKIKELQKISNILKDLSNNIIISGHKNSDLDSMCSSLALAYVLKKLNKNVKVYIEPESISKIKYFNVDNLLSDQIGFDNYTFIALDLNRISRLPNKLENCYLNANYKINIDHHNGNTTNADYVLSISGISSTCEIVYDIVKLMDIKFDKKLSELIFTGIMSDTDLFSSNVSSNTFLIISKLLENNIDNEFLIKKFYLDKTKDEMDIIMYMNNNLIKSNFNYVILDMQKEPFNKVSYAEISKKCIPVILNREDIDILMVIMNFGNKIKGEIRSKNNVDVSKLAELLTGGGHTHAAGFSNEKTINEIIEITKIYLQEEVVC